MKQAPPVLGFCAWGSGAGKTTLLTSLIPLLVQRGLKVSVIKHAHHTFDIDHPGKDSYRLREAGAIQTLVGSRKRWALVTELSRTVPEPPEPGLAELLQQLDDTLVDLILVEGFRQEPITKIEIFRPSLGYPLLAGTDPSIIAVATDAAVDAEVPMLDINSPETVAAFIFAWLKQQSNRN